MDIHMYRYLYMCVYDVSITMIYRYLHPKTFSATHRYCEQNEHCHKIDKLQRKQNVPTKDVRGRRRVGGPS